MMKEVYLWKRQNFEIEQDIDVFGYKDMVGKLEEIEQKVKVNQDGQVDIDKG